ncbi:MAG: CoA transferase [Ilumatobacteraceae bacterium]
MSGPLDGYKIIEIAGIGPGPFAAMLLSDMGAEVIPRRRAGAVRGPAPTHRTATSCAAADATSRSTSAPRRGRDAAAVGRGCRPSSRGSCPGVMERLGVGPDVCLARTRSWSSAA